ncbi:MAG: rod shape-determining protein [Oscillospiraceae bacterium]|nr:rod shape-determining protein [Oscillospiraceae bacterium]
MAQDIGIDLGTANIVMAVSGKGIVINEPSVIAVNKRTNEIIAVGRKAFKMLGKAPEYISVIRPLSCGVISDDEMTQCLIREFVRKASGHRLFKPRIVICVPSFITDVESRAVVEAAMNAGSRKVYLIQEPIAAILGAGVNMSKARGHLVVDIGGGTTDVAVVSMNGVVTSRSIKTAGNIIDQAIVRYMQKRHKILIGDRTAEMIKKEMTNLYDPNDDVKMNIGGRSLLKGLPETVTISELEVFDAVEDEVFEIVEAIRSLLEDTPPELVGDIYENGIILTGGGALLGGLDKLINRTLGVKCNIANDPMGCVARGTVQAFKRLDSLLDGFENVALYQYK